MTVSETVSTFLSGIRKVNTLASYRNTLNPFGEHFQNKEVSGITPAEIRDYIKAMPVSEATQALKFNHIRAFFTYCEIDTYQNGWRQMSKQFKIPKRSGRPLSDTVDNDMATVRGSLRPKHQVVFDLGTRGGLRIGEILKLTPADLVKSGETCCVILEAPKSGAQREAAWVPCDVYLELQDFILKAGIGTTQRIFGMTRQAIWEVFRSRGIAPHDMRRYAAYRAIMNGKDLETVRAFLRHKFATTTANYIGHLSVSALAQKMGGM